MARLIKIRHADSSTIPQLGIYEKKRKKKGGKQE